MKTSEAKKLKITAVNIRSVLIENNKKISKLDYRKSSLVRRQRLRAERAAAEQKIEAKASKGGPIKSVLGNVKGTVMSMWDRIMNFFGYLAMAFLVDKLPAIIKTLTNAFNIVKPLIMVTWKVLSTIGKALFKFGSFIVGIFKPKDAEKNIKLIEEGGLIVGKEIDGLSSNVPGMESDNSQQPGQNEKAKISKVTSDNASQQLKTTEKTEEKREIAAAEKEEKEEEESQSPFATLLGIDPATIAQSGVNSRKAGGMPVMGSESGISNSIVQSSQNLISKVEKVSGDLKGNVESVNTSTVIIPIEVVKQVPVVQGGGGGGGTPTGNPSPMPSSSNNQGMIP